MSRRRIAVLASGGGSNLQALIDHFERAGDGRAGDIVLVASDRANAPALERGRRAGAAVAVLAGPRHPNATPVDTVLDAQAIDLIVLAGYLRLVPPEVTRRYAGQLLNVHPAPLPEFGGPGMYGVRVHRAVLAAGVSMSGPTVHFVDEQFDHGAAIVRWSVPVQAGDDEHSLATRVLRAEHLLYPRVVDRVAAGAITLGSDGTVRAPSLHLDRQLLPFDPGLDDAALSGQLDRLFDP